MPRLDLTVVLHRLLLGLLVSSRLILRFLLISGHLVGCGLLPRSLSVLFRLPLLTAAKTIHAAKQALAVTSAPGTPLSLRLNAFSVVAFFLTITLAVEFRKHSLELLLPPLMRRSLPLGLRCGSGGGLARSLGRSLQCQAFRISVLLDLTVENHQARMDEAGISPVALLIAKLVILITMVLRDLVEMILDVLLQIIRKLTHRLSGCRRILQILQPLVGILVEGVLTIQVGIPDLFHIICEATSEIFLIANAMFSNMRTSGILKSLEVLKHPCGADRVGLNASVLTMGVEVSIEHRQVKMLFVIEEVLNRAEVLAE